MKTCLTFLLFAWLLLGPASASAGEPALLAAIEQQRQHGFHSPARAAADLRAAAGDLQGVSAAVRMEYLARVSALDISSENYADFDSVMGQLQHMAATEKCVACGYYVLIRKARRAAREEDLDTMSKLVAELDKLAPPSDRALQVEVDFMHAVRHEQLGDNERAVEAAIRAVRGATATEDAGMLVRSLNQLFLINIHRRDMVRAEQAGQEAFQLAEKIGYTFQMIYIKINQAWMHGLKEESARQLAALTEALRLTRTQVGLHDAELLNLINLADFHSRQKDFARAIALNRQAIDLAERHRKHQSKAVAMISLGEAQYQFGQRAQGIATLEESVRQLGALGSQSYQLNAYTGLIAAYADSGRYRDAYNALQAQVALQEKSMLAEREKAVSKAQAAFAAERKDHEIERLSLENARHAAEAASRAWRQWLWAAAAVILAMGTVILLHVVRRARRRNQALEVSNAVLSDQSVHDPLTGAFNRRHCETFMSQHAAVLTRQAGQGASSRSIGLMLIDVDHFKHVNDSVGHAGGDAVLVEVARRLKALVREQDVVVRWGGEEFVLILPGTSAAGLLQLAERVLQAVAAAPIAAEGTMLKVTVSAGAVGFPLAPPSTWQDCMKVADAAMYLAKQGGRNRACCVSAVDAGVSAQSLAGGLAQAAEAGLAVLETVRGPG